MLEALDALKQITLVSVHLAGYPAYQSVPTPRAELRPLLSAAGIELPQTLPQLETRVVTRKNSSKSRK